MALIKGSELQSIILSLVPVYLSDLYSTQNAFLMAIIRQRPAFCTGGFGLPGLEIFWLSWNI